MAYSKEVRDHALSLYFMAGASMDEAAVHVGACVGTVSKWIDRYGYEFYLENREAVDALRRRRPVLLPCGAEVARCAMEAVQNVEEGSALTSGATSGSITHTASSAKGVGLPAVVI